LTNRFRSAILYT